MQLGSLNGMPSIFHERFCRRVFICGVNPFILVFQERVRECLCVAAFSAGTISAEGKEHRETLKELLCTFEWNDPKKAFFFFIKNTFHSDFYLQKGTYSITSLPPSLSASIHPASILRPVSVLCVEALPWANSMSLVVEQCRACQRVDSE